MTVLDEFALLRQCESMVEWWDKKVIIENYPYLAGKEFVSELMPDGTYSVVIVPDFIKIDFVVVR